MQRKLASVVETWQRLVETPYKKPLGFAAWGQRKPCYSASQSEEKLGDYRKWHKVPMRIKTSLDLYGKNQSYFILKRFWTCKNTYIFPKYKKINIWTFQTPKLYMHQHHISQIQSNTIALTAHYSFKTAKGQLQKAWEGKFIGDTIETKQDMTTFFCWVGRGKWLRNGGSTERQGWGMKKGD